MKICFRKGIYHNHCIYVKTTRMYVKTTMKVQMVRITDADSTLHLSRRLWAPLSNKSWTATLGNLGQVNRRISVVIYSYIKLLLSCTILLQNLHNIRLQLLKLSTFIMFAYTNTLQIEFFNKPHVKLVKMIILFQNNSID